MSAIDQRTEEQREIDRRVRSRVIQGLTLLQETFGESWVDHIDLRKLDLANCTNCVLGQLYEKDAEKGGYSDGYYYGIHTLEIDGSQYGFNTDDELQEELYSEDVDHDYMDDLTFLWREEIRALRAKRP